MRTPEFFTAATPATGPVAGLSWNSRQTGVVRFGLKRVIDRPINSIDRPRLSIRGRRWQREVGVASELSKQCQLVVEAAVPAVGA